MEVNRINENTIRVRIDKNELASRGLKVLDLLGNKEQIQHFFYSILDEVDADHSFAQDTPVTFQVMPNNGGLDLLISKVGSQEQGMANNDNLKQFFDDPMNQSSTSEQDMRKTFFDFSQEDEKEEYEDENSLEAPTYPWEKKTHQAYSFTDFNAVIELADSLHSDAVDSQLYFDRDKYYLDLRFKDGCIDMKPSDVWVIANEYGIKVTFPVIGIAQDYGKCLMATDALGQVRRYFTTQKD